MGDGLLVGQLRARQFLILALTLFAGNAARAGGNIPFGFVPALGMSIVWTGGGADAAWSTAANWRGGKVPNTTSEIAVFDGTCTTNCSPHITANLTAFSIIMDSTYAGTIFQDSGKTLSVSNTWTINGGTFSGGDSAIVVTNLFIQSGGTFTASTGTTTFNWYTTSLLGGTFNGTAGPLVFNNPNIYNTFKASSTTTTCTTGTVFNVGASFNANGGTWILLRNTSGTSYPADYAGVTFNNLKIQNTIAGGAFSIFGSSLTVGGDLILDNSVSSGSSITSNSIAVAGNVQLTSGYGFSGSTTISLTKPGAVNVNATGATAANLPSLQLTGAGSTVTFTGSPIVNSNFGCPTGQTNSVTGAFSVGGNITAFCTFTGDSAITLTGPTASTVNVTSGFPTGTLTVNKSGSTVTLARLLNLAGSGQAMAIQAGTFLMNAKALTVNGNLSISSGATLTQGGGVLTYGSLSNSGTLNP